MGTEITMKDGVMPIPSPPAGGWLMSLKAALSDKLVSLDNYGGNVPEGMILIKDVIADAFLQQILTRTAEYDVVATMNFNGDYISDALAAPGAVPEYSGFKMRLRFQLQNSEILSLRTCVGKKVNYSV